MNKDMFSRPNLHAVISRTGTATQKENKFAFID